MNTIDPDNLKYDENGLIPAIAQDNLTGEVLMLAWMNRAAVERTFATGRVTYWSRSRSELWQKGKTSGNIQKLVTGHIDCDRDCLLIKVEQTGPACHTGERSCFFTPIDSVKKEDK